ncbi:MAG: hypothetical protein KF718_15165 [Polyangiaceae bacterium]|nr:hypothetical protein [Polyangiaceae bacterium]
MNYEQYAAEATLCRRDARLAPDGEPTAISRVFVDPWGVMLLFAVVSALLFAGGSLQVAQTRPFVPQDALLLLVPLFFLWLFGVAVASGVLRTTVFANEEGLIFKHRRQWYEVDWKHTGNLEPVWWDFRFSRTLYAVELLDGSKPQRVYLVPTSEAHAVIEHYRTQRAKRTQGRAKRKRAQRRAAAGS